MDHSSPLSHKSYVRMESGVITSREVGESSIPFDDDNNNSKNTALHLRLASSTVGNLRDHVSSSNSSNGDAAAGLSNSQTSRQRRHKRLVDNKSAVVAALRPSPPTISENQSMDHHHYHYFDNDKLSISADATAETTMLSNETIISTPDNNSNNNTSWLKRVSTTPTTSDTTHSSIESVNNEHYNNNYHNAALPPKSIVTTTRTCPPSPPPPASASGGGTTNNNDNITPAKRSQYIPTTRIIPKSNSSKSSRIAPLPIRPPSQSLWGGKDETTSAAAQQQHTRQDSRIIEERTSTPPPPITGPGPIKLIPFDEQPTTTTSAMRYPKPRPSSSSLKKKLKEETKSSSNNKALLASRSKPNLQRHSTAPVMSSSTMTTVNNKSTTTNQETTTNVADDVLMDRAFIIRQNLMNFEMQELAAEAEKAAESGMEKFVGSTSKFGNNAKETPPYRPTFVDNDDIDQGGDGFVMMTSLSSSRGGNLISDQLLLSTGGGFRTPVRQKKSFVDVMDYTPYTPSYFARKKIPVMSLRNFTEIVPNFNDMHNNIRIHLDREGVNMVTLPKMHKCRSLIKNDTDDTNENEGREVLDGGGNGNDGEEEVEKEIVDGDATVISLAPSVASSFSSYAVASLTSLREIIDTINRPKSSMDNTSLRPCSSMSNASSGGPSRGGVDQKLKKNKSVDSGLPPARFKRAVASTVNDSDSDDSSVEFYGARRASPLDFFSTNQSVCSNRSNLSSSDINQVPRKNGITSEIQQPILQRRRIGKTNSTSGAHSVSFETEKANYQALLDRMHNKTLSKTDSFDVDQSSCAPSLTNLEILPTSSGPMSDTMSPNKATPMANFLNKIQNQFSRSSDGQNNKDLDEDNKHFVSNFFYTSQNSDSSGMVDPSTIKLEINPKRRIDSYCLSGCGPNDLIPMQACETAGKFADLVFGWFNVRGGGGESGSSQHSYKKSAIIDPNHPSEQATNPNWIKTWQQGNESSENGSEHLHSKIIFTPPKLSVRYEQHNHESASICSPTEQLKLGRDDEWEGSTGMDCSEIKSNIPGCSPEFSG